MMRYSTTHSVILLLFKLLPTMPEFYCTHVVSADDSVELQLPQLLHSRVIVHVLDRIRLETTHLQLVSTLNQENVDVDSKLVGLEL